MKVVDPVDLLYIGDLGFPFLIGFSIINHPFWGTPIFGNTYMVLVVVSKLAGGFKYTPEN